MKKAIYRVKTTFEWSNRQKTLRKTKSKEVEMDFITTCTTAAEILTDSWSMGKILHNIGKRANEITLKIINVEVISEHGETNDRFLT